MSAWKDKLAGWHVNGSSATPAEGDMWTWDNTTGYFRIRAILTAIAHAMTSAAHTATAWRVFYSNGSGVVTELALGAAPTYLRSAGASAAPVFGGVTPTAATRAAAVDTAYQPSTTLDVLILASVQISSGVAGDGKIEAMTDSANPPTTVVGTFRVGTAATVIGGQLAFLVKAGHYYKLTTTSTGGAPTFSVVGNVYELAL